MFRNTIKKSLPMLAGALIIALVVSILPSGYFAEASKDITTKVVAQKYITLEQAELIALTKVNDKKAEIVEFELVLKNGAPIYDFEIVTETHEYEIKVDGITRQIIDFDKDKIEKEKLDEYKVKKQLYKEYRDNVDKGIYKSKQEAKLIALKQVNDKTVEITNLEIVLKGKVPHYLVVARTKTHEYTMKIKADTGIVYDLVIVAKHNNGNNNNNTSKPVVEVKYITKEKAIQIAIARIGSNATLDEIEFEKGDNPPKYEIEMYDDKYEYEIEIHAITGAVLDFEREED